MIMMMLDLWSLQFHTSSNTSPRWTIAQNLMTVENNCHVSSLAQGSLACCIALCWPAYPLPQRKSKVIWQRINFASLAIVHTSWYTRFPGALDFDLTFPAPKAMAVLVYDFIFWTAPTWENVVLVWVFQHITSHSTQSGHLRQWYDPWYLSFRAAWLSLIQTRNLYSMVKETVGPTNLHAENTLCERSIF